jgi:hypothetical protein
LDPRFASSNPAESYVFLGGIKIHSITSFGGEVKLSAPCRKILRHVKNATGMKEILVGKVQQLFYTTFLSALLLGVSATTRAENSGG